MAAKHRSQRQRTPRKPLGGRAGEVPTAITVRLAPDLRRHLNFLRGVLKRPVNKLITEAVEGFVQKQNQELRADLKDLLTQIENYNRQDPKFDKAFQQWEEAEAGFGHADPAEGVRVRTKAVKRPATPIQPATPIKIKEAQSLVRQLLNR